MNPLVKTIAAANPWLGLAAQLADAGLPKLAAQVRKQPETVVREMASALEVAAAPGKLEAAVASDPDAIDKLAEIELTIFAAEEESRQSARDAWKGTYMMGFTAFFAFAVLLLFGLALWRAGFDGKDAATYGRLLSTLENVLLIVVGFLFGSSVGSKLKGPMDGQK